jgi:hypothetical protein
MPMKNFIKTLSENQEPLSNATLEKAAAEFNRIGDEYSQAGEMPKPDDYPKCYNATVVSAMQEALGTAGLPVTPEVASQVFGHDTVTWGWSQIKSDDLLQFFRENWYESTPDPSDWDDFEYGSDDDECESDDDEAE